VSNLARSASSEVTLYEGGHGSLDQWRHRRRLARLDKNAEVRSRAIELDAELGRDRIQAVLSVGGDAQLAQAALSAQARSLVETEPSAVHAVAELSYHTTAGLARVIDKTVREVTK